VIIEGENLLQNNPDNFFLAQTVANAYLGEGVITNDRVTWANKAVALLEELTKKNGDNTESERIIGYAYFLLKNYNEANKHYQSAVTLDQKNDLALADLAQLYELQGDFTKSNDLYEKALSMNASNTMAIVGKARSYLQAKDYKRAKDQLSLGMKEIEKDRLSLASADEMLGQIDLQNRAFASAHRYFEKSITENPASGGALGGLALAMIGEISTHTIGNIKDETAKPEELAEKAVALEPDSPYGYVILAKIARLRRDDTGLKDLSAKILKLVPNDKTLSAEDRQALLKQFSTNKPRITNLKIISIEKLSAPPDHLGPADVKQK
jgi:tetratricopeptide (TPR) repeat protein